MDMDKLAEQMRSRLDAGGIDSRVKLDLGNGKVLLIDGDAVSTADGEADCVVSISEADLEQMIAGNLDPVGAFMSGKIRIDGDMSAAMALTKIL